MSAQTDRPLGVPAHDASGFSTRLAVFLSAAVCPGAGHFIQRRRVLGVLFLTAFVACLVMLLLAVVLPLMTNLRIALDFAEKENTGSFRTISIVKVLTWFGLAVLVYLAALADIIVYARRQARRRLNEHQKALVSMN